MDFTTLLTPSPLRCVRIAPELHPEEWELRDSTLGNGNFVEGHLDAARKNYKSTQKTPEGLIDPLLRELLDDAFPPHMTEGT